MNRKQWPALIGKMMARGTHAEAAAEHFGGLVSPQTMAKWRDGRSIPPQWTVDVYSYVLDNGLQADRGKTDIDDLLKLPDISYRLKTLGVSKELAYQWRAGARPHPWIIPFLRAAVKAVPDDIAIQDIEHERKKASSIVCGLKGDKRKIVEAYFGLRCKAHTLSEVADRMGCSKQYIHSTIKSLGLKTRPRSNKV